MYVISMGTSPRACSSLNEGTQWQKIILDSCPEDKTFKPSDAHPQNPRYYSLPTVNPLAMPLKIIMCLRLPTIHKMCKCAS